MITVLCSSSVKKTILKVKLEIKVHNYLFGVFMIGQLHIIYHLCFYIFESLVDDDHFAIYNPPTNLVKF